MSIRGHLLTIRIFIFLDDGQLIGQLVDFKLKLYTNNQLVSDGYNIQRCNCT